MEPEERIAELEAQVASLTLRLVSYEQTRNAGVPGDTADQSAWRRLKANVARGLGAESGGVVHKAVRAFESPLQKATRLFSEHRTKLNLTAAEVDELGAALRALHDANIYTPVFDKIFTALPVDEHTRSWMLHEYASARERTAALQPKTAATPEPALVGAPSGEPVDDKWGIPMFDAGDSDLIKFAHACFEDLRLLTRFEISAAKFEKFARQVLARYRDNPYHNKYHAIDVTHMLLNFLKASRLTSIACATDLLAIMLAGLCHDLDHPGVNNAFLIQTADPLALLYNDKSVLENHHSSLAWGLVVTTGLLAHMSEGDRRRIRSIMVDSILSTDMSRHFDHVTKLTGMIRTRGACDALSPLSEADQHVALELLLHAADISTAVKDWDVQTLWAKRVADEFYSQGDREKELGMVPAPFMDRDKANGPQNQIDFIDFICLPYFTPLAELFPGTDMDRCVAQLNESRNNFVQQLPRDTRPRLDHVVMAKSVLQRRRATSQEMVQESQSNSLGSLNPIRRRRKRGARIVIKRSPA